MSFPPSTVTTEYGTPYSAIVRDEIVMGVSRYFLERWVPILGPGAATVVLTLRQLDYRCHGEVISISGEALAREAAMSRRYLYTCLDVRWMAAFVHTESGKRTRTESGKFIQDANRYTVRIDDPLTPADADHLITVLTRLGDTPLDAAQRALELNARDLWAPHPTQRSERFTEARPITARDALRRAFPTWQTHTEEQKVRFSQAAENLHRHMTLVRDDGQISKIIVPQYFRKHWWKRLGHDLAWSYLWLRGCVYENPEEGIWRDTCWVSSINRLLTLIGRTREWWRRNVENAPANEEGWTLDDFFMQIDAQKGRDPRQPQWVARQFWVNLEIPIAPEDRNQHNLLLQQWRGAGFPPQPDQGSASPPHTGDEGLSHDGAHRPDGGPPPSNTPDQPGSAPSAHTGDPGVHHTRTQRSATSTHRKSKFLKEALDLQAEPSDSSSKHQDAKAAAPDQKTAAAAENDKNAEGIPDKITSGISNKILDEIPNKIPDKIPDEVPDEKQPLFECLEEILARAPETPLFRAARVTTWLRDVWPEPIRPHTPVWTAVINGQVSPHDLVALMLAIWADTSIKHPPRYLSWLIQRWQTLPAVSPVDHWEQWKMLAGMTLQDWMQRGRLEWIELAPQNNRALPFGLETLAADYDYGEVEDDPAPRLLPPPEPPPPAEPDGLDERPGGGSLTVRDIWRATLGQLSVQLNPSTYTNWVEGTKAVSYADGVLTVCARHGVARDLLAQRLNSSIELSVSQLARTPITVRYTAVSNEGGGGTSRT